MTPDKDSNPEKIKNLASYIAKINHLNNGSGLKNETTYLWFRGQDNCDWDLMPTLFRLSTKKNWEREMIRDFKLHAYELLEKLPQNEMEWLFVMQHYGLPTRLLDWSESHLIALYFSVVNYNSNCDGKVWVLNPWDLNRISMREKTVPISTYEKFTKYTLNNPHTTDQEVKAELPAAVRPTRNSTRIIGQKGTFTIHGKDIRSLNDIIEDKNSKEERIYFKHLIIDGKSKLNILKELYLAGISYSVIFPELHGICNDIKIRYSDAFLNTGKKKLADSARGSRVAPNRSTETSTGE